MVGYANPKCYARELGDCSQQISREHYISKALIARMESIGIAGFGFQEPGTIKTVGLQSVVSKILCQKHNSDLSPLDHEAGELFAALRRFDADLHEDVERPEQEHVLLSGALLERWLLKVLAGLVHGGTVGSSRLRSGFPWLRILFGLEGWPDGAGLGAYVSLAQHAFEGIEIETATVGEEAWGTTFDLAGVSLWLGLGNTQDAGTDPAGSSSNRPATTHRRSSNSAGPAVIDLSGSPTRALARTPVLGRRTNRFDASSTDTFSG